MTDYHSFSNVHVIRRRMLVNWAYCGWNWSCPTLNASRGNEEDQKKSQPGEPVSELGTEGRASRTGSRSAATICSCAILNAG